MATKLSQSEAMFKNYATVNSDNYDFTNFIFINTRTKSTYVCKKHILKFEMTPSNFWMGHGCSLCAIENQIKSRTGIKVVHKIRKTNIQIVNEFVRIHGQEKYDYANVNYEKNNKKVEIICRKHGLFYQTPNKHLLGRGCPLCANETRNVNNRWSWNQFVMTSNRVHNTKYIYENQEYKGALSYVEIRCSKHGTFKQKAIDHLNGHGCKKCGLELNQAKLLKSTEQIISRANKVHNYFYNYSKVVYTGIYNKVIIICPIHGEFAQVANTHLRGAGCPKCNQSKGEKLISKILSKNNITYTEQHKFIDCKNKVPLPFDFYLSELNICIEFQGEQHYSIMEHWGGKAAFEKVLINDSIKKLYCISNRIKLIEVPFYADKNQIEEFILQELTC